MGLVAKRSLRVEANFEEILDDYFKTKLPCVGGLSPVVPLLCSSFSDSLTRLWM